MASGNLSSWMATARDIFDQAYPGRSCAVRVTLTDADNPTAALSYLVPRPHPAGQSAVGFIQVEPIPEGLPLKTMPLLRATRVSKRERAILEVAASRPITARDAHAALVAKGAMRPAPKIPQSVRILLSRMACRRGLLLSPGPDHCYRISPLGSASVEH